MNPREQQQMNETLNTLQQRGQIFTEQMFEAKEANWKLEDLCKEKEKEVKRRREEVKQKAIDLLNLHVLTPNPAYQRADGLNPTKLADINQKKLVANLEARLNKALIRNATTINENNAIKAKIDKLRQKRLNDNFNRLSLEKKLRNLQRQLDVVMETAAKAAEQREAYIDKKNQLLSDNIDEAAEFNEAYARLGEYIDTQNELLEKSIEKAAKAVKFDNAATEDVSTRGMLSVSEEKKKQQDIILFDKTIREQDKTYRQTENKIEQYKKEFADLFAVAGSTDMDEIATTFCANEDDSFRLFTHIQTVNQETDQVQQQFDKLCADIKAYEDQGRSKERQRVEEKLQLEQGVVDAKEENRQLMIQAEDEQKTVLNIAKRVSGLFYKINCESLLEGKSNQGGRLAFLNGQSVDENNILQFMGIIEERATQIVRDHVKFLAQQGEAGKRRRKSISQTQSLAGSLDKNITGRPQALEIFDSDDEDDDGDKVFSRDAILSSVKNVLESKGMSP
eukprot:CAMPEP_0118651542 /NCGR_PEP_ID=MMETSP0785-20121206/10842_1 /TAXON_ID=91992 /ORGANISM="Bolidomonas pacifica, Strain CCMP 1866" /LENGTH=506 /DNA_ID=CAMNT_0006544003 /DNA_START=118 /DNA_END=1635 /DNA_ORIENTATION=-